MPFPVVHGSLLNPPHVRKSKLFNEIRVNGSEILDCPMNLSVGGACAQVNTLVCFANLSNHALKVAGNQILLSEDTL